MALTGRLAVAAGVAWSLYQLFHAVAGPPHVFLQRTVHVMLALAVAFWGGPKPAAGSGPTEGPAPAARPRDRLDALAGAAAVAVGAYLVGQFDRLARRAWFSDPPAPLDAVAGLVTVGLLLWASTRIVGRALTAVALAFFAYAAAGPLLRPWLPGLSHPGISFRHFIDLEFLSPHGIFGLPTGVSADYVFYFILFAAFLEALGAGEVFQGLVPRAAARGRALGAARVAIAGATVMGTVSGSALANVVSTGVFAIPLLRSAGYSALVAAAVVAVASTGAQLTPPIMGAAAFVMAGVAGYPYRTIVAAAALPALIYYFALYIALVFHTRRAFGGGQGKAPRPAQAPGPAPAPGPGTAPAAPTAAPPRGRRLDLVLVLAPVGVILYLILRDAKLMVAGLYGMLAAVAVSYLPALVPRAFGAARPPIGPRRLAGVLYAGARSAASVAVPCAVAGMIVGVIIYTGLAVKLTGLILDWSGGRLLPALGLVTLGCVVLGMGMPTTSAYIMGAVLLVPALIELGVPRLVAHFFIFYFSVMSMITPPVALSSYAAAGLAGTDMMATGWLGFRLTFPAFLVPFAFVYQPALIGLGTPGETVWVTATTLLGVAALAAALAGHFLRPTRPAERLALFVAAGLLITPEGTSDLVGLGLFAAVWWGQRLRQRAE